MNTWQARLAVRVLQRGGLVAHATEGVWGLACNPWDGAAVARLLALKGRAAGKGLIVIGTDATDFQCELNAVAAGDRERVAASWPGPVTWILPNQRFPAWICGGRETVAVRVPGHAQARALCRAFGGALVSTSANRAGWPAPRNRFQLQRRLAEARHHSREPLAPDSFYVLPGETGGRRAASDIRTLEGRTLRQAR